MEPESYDVENMPFDMLFEICKFSGSLVLLTTSKTFSGYVTTGITLDFMEFLGYDVKISQTFDKRSRLVWKFNGLFHRPKFPAIEYSDGEKHWYRHGKLHREDGPAIEYSDGEKHWYRHGQLHREDGPAIEHPNESVNGKRHRTTEWHINGERHRENGPAIEWEDGDAEWYMNGKRHRIGGPAIEYKNTNKYFWYIDGILEISFQS